MTMHRSFLEYWARRALRLPEYVTFSLVFLLFIVVCLSRLDPDFGWHLVSGQYFTAHGIPAHDIFSFTAPDFPWVDHEWLSDIALYHLYLLGGYTLLAFTHATLWTATVWLIGRGRNSTIILVAALAVVPFAGVRALTWTIICLALLTVLLRVQTRRRLYLIPALFLLWANIHGGFVAGLLYLALTAARQRSWRLGLLGCLSVGVTFLNPYGFQVYVEIFRTLTDPSLHRQVREWQPLKTPWISWPFISLWLVGLVAELTRHWRRFIRPSSLFLTLSLTSVRNTPLFVVLALPEVDDWLTRLYRRIARPLDWKRSLVILCAGVIFIGATATATAYEFRTISFDPQASYPRTSARYLRAHPCAGNIFNNYDDGGYLIWKVPGEKVYIDGRMPSWRHDTTKYMDDYVRMYRDTAFRMDQFAYYNIRCVVMKKHEAGFVKDLQNLGWRVAASDHDDVLLLDPDQ